jgi:hypothetical protein
MGECRNGARSEERKCKGDAAAGGGADQIDDEVRLNPALHIIERVDTYGVQLV